jgi:poly-beta-1,6-N-acetyl-D-glucosamine synthase
MERLFWWSIFVVFYAYLGYGLLLLILIRIKKAIKKAAPFATNLPDSELPAVTLLVAAYNEAAWIEEKLRNSFALDYPLDKIHFFFVTDGSDDGTPSLIEQFPKPAGVQLKLFHQAERKGKIAAVERVMPFVDTPIVVFTDANTTLNPEAIRKLVPYYLDPNVGSVSGEKRIAMTQEDEASSAGEGLYWKYESTLKRWDAQLYSLVGAAGELFSIRTSIYEPAPLDSIAEDFYTTLRIAQRGYRVLYAPEAYAVEQSSASVAEELKRKIRISAGGLQTIWRLRSLLNPFRYGVLTFQYVSHRVLRLTLAPLALPLLLVLNGLMALQGSPFYGFLFALQCLFYLLAILGYFFERRKIKIKAFFIPYYFCMMNYAVYRGFFRLLAGKQSVLWERPLRKV